MIRFISRRLDVLYDSDSFLTGSLNENVLTSLRLQERFESLISYGTNALETFNFQKAIEHFTAAYSLVENNGSDLQRINALGFLGLAHYYHADHKEAKTCFERLLKFDEKNVTVLFYLTVLTLINKDSKINVQSLHFLAQKLHEKNYLVFLLNVLHNLIQKRNSDQLIEDIRTLEVFIPIKSDIYYLEVGSILADHGIADEAILSYKIAFQQTQCAARRGQIVSNIGTVFANQDKHEEAIKWYVQALEHDPCNATIYGNMAASYAYFFNFTSAQKYVKCAIELTKDYPKPEEYVDKLRFDETVYEIMQTQRININKIPPTQPEIKRALSTAEKRFLEVQQDKRKHLDDVSDIVIGYAKVLEMILHEQISYPFLDYLHAQFWSSRHNDIWLPDNMWKASKWYLRDLKKTKGVKSITLGQWKDLINDLKSKTMGLAQQLKQSVITRFDNRVLGHIAAACKVLTDPRNIGAHRGIISFDEIIDLRPKIAKSLNSVIDVLY